MVTGRTLHLAGVLENTDYAFQITTMENNRQSSSSGRLGPPLGKSGPHSPHPALRFALGLPTKPVCDMEGTRDLAVAGQAWVLMQTDGPDKDLDSLWVSRSCRSQSFLLV